MNTTTKHNLVWALAGLLAAALGLAIWLWLKPGSGQQPDDIEAWLKSQPGIHAAATPFELKIEVVADDEAAARAFSAALQDRRDATGKPIVATVRLELDGGTSTLLLRADHQIPDDAFTLLAAPLPGDATERRIAFDGEEEYLRDDDRWRTVRYYGGDPVATGLEVQGLVDWNVMVYDQPQGQTSGQQLGIEIMKTRDGATHVQDIRSMAADVRKVQDAGIAIAELKRDVLTLEDSAATHRAARLLGKHTLLTLWTRNGRTSLDPDGAAGAITSPTRAEALEWVLAVPGREVSWGSSLTLSFAGQQACEEYLASPTWQTGPIKIDCPVGKGRVSSAGTVAETKERWEAMRAVADGGAHVWFGKTLDLRLARVDEQAIRDLRGIGWQGTMRVKITVGEGKSATRAYFDSAADGRAGPLKAGSTDDASGLVEVWDRSATR